ncbi:UNVERIFIED_CONTAM: hypothetical protein HDU68_009475 [Siphonaria sp. JEL0065]|nr:hypothetical protein HDU68_009475 [Siphonaria sp. JEL0065]
MSRRERDLIDLKFDSRRDWTCPSCFNINWAKRATCNQCHIPKPGTGQDQEREGRGGGFKERDDVVEYKNTRFESDDEYDDFGRKKKKRNRDGPKSDTSSNSRTVAARSTGDANDKKEEEDDEDDGEDDGKWDAWNDILGDDAKTIGKKEEPVKNEKGNSSRSSGGGYGTRDERGGDRGSGLSRNESPSRRRGDSDGRQRWDDRGSDYRRDDYASSRHRDRGDCGPRDRTGRDDYSTRDRPRDQRSDVRRAGDYDRRRERSQSPPRRDNYRR